MLDGFGTRYEDVLKKSQLEAARRSRTGAQLEQRAWLFRPTSRTSPETIHVASLVCFVFSPMDLGRVLAGAATRNATIIAHDDNLVIPPNPPADLISKALQSLDTAKRRAAGQLTGMKGYQVSVANRLSDTARRIELIRGDWARREHPTVELLARAGRSEGKPLSYTTAVAKLGTREQARKKADDHAAWLVRKEAMKEVATNE